MMSVLIARTAVVLVLCSTVLASEPGLFAELVNGLRSRHEVVREARTQQRRGFSARSLIAKGGQGMIRVYQNHISTQYHSSCMFEPSCSEFSRRCLSTYSLPKALLLTSDRLLRCNGLGFSYYPFNSESGRCIDHVAEYGRP